MIGQRLEAQLVDRIRCVRNQLTQEDILVAVERVDNDIKQLLDLGLETERFLVRLYAHRATSPKRYQNSRFLYY